VVDSVDEPLLRELRAMRNAPWRERPHYLYRAWRFWQYEKLMLGRADQTVFVSEVDAGVYRRFFPGRPVTVVPNGVDIEYFAPLSTKPDPAYVVFEGNMNYGPNIDTAQRLVREILPRLSSRVGEVQIGIVGRDPSPEVLRLASDRVEVTGSVADVRPFLARATVFACPMRLGSGIKNKILQAWAMGRPVVATTASLGGLAARDGVNILVRDRPQEFADAVAQLIRAPARADTIGVAGRQTVETEYSWARRAEQFESVLLAAAGAEGHSGRGTGAEPRGTSDQVPLAPAKSG
jgi:glycosyltransferase involved in cell wall biosynthesis